MVLHCHQTFLILEGMRARGNVRLSLETAEKGTYLLEEKVSNGVVGETFRLLETHLDFSIKVTHLRPILVALAL